MSESNEMFQDGGNLQPHPPTGDPGNNRRMSLGSLMGKGIVSARRGFWEQSKVGAGARKNPRGGPLAQSHDRGLLFEVPAALETAASDVSIGAPDTSLLATVPAAGSKGPKTPSSLKKMWLSMTGRSPRAQLRESVDQATQPTETDTSMGSDLVPGPDQTSPGAALPEQTAQLVMFEEPEAAEDVLHCEGSSQIVTSETPDAAAVHEQAFEVQASAHEEEAETADAASPCHVSTPCSPAVSHDDGAAEPTALSPPPTVAIPAAHATELSSLVHSPTGEAAEAEKGAAGGVFPLSLAFADDAAAVPATHTSAGGASWHSSVGDVTLAQTSDAGAAVATLSMGGAAQEQDVAVTSGEDLAATANSTGTHIPDEQHVASPDSITASEATQAVEATQHGQECTQEGTETCTMPAAAGPHQQVEADDEHAAEETPGQESSLVEMEVEMESSTDHTAAMSVPAECEDQAASEHSSSVLLEDTSAQPEVAVAQEEHSMEEPVHAAAAGDDAVVEGEQLVAAGTPAAHVEAQQEHVAEATIQPPAEPVSVQLTASGIASEPQLSSEPDVLARPNAAPEKEPASTTQASSLEEPSLTAITAAVTEAVGPAPDVAPPADDFNISMGSQEDATPPTQHAALQITEAPAEVAEQHSIASPAPPSPAGTASHPSLDTCDSPVVAHLAPQSPDAGNLPAVTTTGAITPSAQRSSTGVETRIEEATAPITAAAPLTEAPPAEAEGPDGAPEADMPDALKGSPGGLAYEMYAALNLSDDCDMPGHSGETFLTGLGSTGASPAASKPAQQGEGNSPAGSVGSAAAHAPSITLEHSTHSAALGLLDMEMEDAEMLDATGEQTMLNGTAGDGFVPPLETTPSPVGSPRDPVMDTSTAQAPVQVVRESLPLFVRDSYLVNDSMSLERQSLNSVEPFSAGSQARPSAAMQAALMASTRAPLGTLQEEESFCDDSASAPGGVPALAGRAPTFFQKAAAKAAKAAGGVAGVEEHDLPRNLPDPQVLGGGVTAMDITPVKPAVAGAGSLFAEAAAVAARESAKKASPAPASATKPSPAGANMSGGGSVPTTPQPSTAASPRIPPVRPGNSALKTGSAAAPVAGSGARAATGKPGAPGSRLPGAGAMGTPLTRMAGGADPAATPLVAAKSGIKPPVTAGKRPVTGPTPVRAASAAGAAATGPAASHTQQRSNSAGGVPVSSAATPAGSRAGSGGGAHAVPLGTPVASMAAAPRLAAATPMAISPLATAQSPMAAAPGLPQPAFGAAPGGKAAATPGPGQLPATPADAVATTPGLVVAPMPHIPQGFNTPMAQLQQYVGNAVHAPLLDLNSPFDDNLMLTADIAEEAKRLMMNLEGNTTSSVGAHAPASPQAFGSPAADFAFAPIRAPEPSSSGTIFGAGSASTPYQPTGTASHAGGVSPAMGLLAGASTTGGAAGTPSLGGASTASAPGMSPLGGNTTGTGAYGLLELQKSTLLERLVAAEERAREAERTNEQLRDQIKTMDWGGMLAGAGDEDMERQARLAAEESLQLANGQIAVLTETVRNMQQAAVEVQGQTSQLLERADGLATRVDQLTQELAAAKAQEQQACAKAQELQGSLGAAQSEVAGLRSAVEEAGARAAAAERDVARLRGARNEAQAALKASTDQLIAEQLARKQQEAEAARQVGAMQASLERLQAEREALRREVAEAAGKRAEAEAQHASEVAKLKRENGELMRMAEELMGALEKERSKSKK